MLVEKNLFAIFVVKIERILPSPLVLENNIFALLFIFTNWR